MNRRRVVAIPVGPPHSLEYTLSCSPFFRDQLTVTSAPWLRVPEAVNTPPRPPPSLAPYLYWPKRKQTIIDKMASEGLPLTVIIQEAARIWP